MKVINRFIGVSLLLLSTCFSLKAQEVQVIRDLSYFDGADRDSDKHKLDLYLPKGLVNPPMMLWIHGGAWAYGGRHIEEDLARQFASKGIAMAAMSYRLSPGTWKDPTLTEGIQHPEHIRDVARAFKWLNQNASEYGYSQENLFVSGYSAGGHLSALLCVDPTYLKEVDMLTASIKGAIPIAGAYDISNYHQVFVEGSEPSLAVEHVEAVFGPTEAHWKKASPTTYAEQLNTPMLVVSENQTYNYTRLFEKAIKAAQKPDVKFLHVREMGHGDFYRHLANASDSEYRDQIIRFVLELAGAGG